MASRVTINNAARTPAYVDVTTAISPVAHPQAPHNVVWNLTCLCVCVCVCVCVHARVCVHI